MILVVPLAILIVGTAAICGVMWWLYLHVGIK